MRHLLKLHQQDVGYRHSHSFVYHLGQRAQGLSRTDIAQLLEDVDVVFAKEFF
jgi:hypothetical protein